MNEKPARLRIAPTLPFIAILIGLYEFESAWLAVILYHAGIVFYIVKYKQKLDTLVRGWNSLFGIILISIGAFSGLALYLLWPFVHLQAFDFSASMAAFGLSGYSWHLFFAYSILVHPVLEELFWRSVLLGTDKYPSWHDIWFASYHILVLVRFVKVPWLILFFLILTFMAGLWRYLAIKYKGLLLPFTSHLVAYASIFLAVYVIIG
jgi:membrane protease YdiL (CAAX protease family)